MKKFVEVIHLLERIDRKCLVENPTAEELDKMRMKFAQITVFGNMMLNDKDIQVWEDESGNLAIIDRLWKEAAVFYAGKKYIVDEVKEA